MTRLLCFICAISFAFSVQAETADGAPKVTHTPKNESLVADQFEVRATIEDPDGIFDPTLLYRLEGAKEFKRLAMQLKGTEYIAIIENVETDQVIEYFIEAFDNLGNGPALMGTPEAPFVVRIASAKSLTPAVADTAVADKDKTKVEATPDDGKSVEKDTEAKSDKQVGDTLEVQETKNEGSAAGIWIGAGVAATVVLAAGAGVAGYFYFTREDLPDEVKVTISAPLPVRGALQ